jgi:hypothetical protein
VEVRAAKAAEPWPVSTSAVDRQGRYRLEDLTAGSWRLTASHVPSGQQARGDLTIPAGSTEASLDLRFGGGITLTGRVVQGDAPVRGADLPVFFGGESGPALRRVAEYGNGWIGFNLTPDEAAAKIRRIEDLLRANGRKRSDVELAVSNSGKPITPDDLKRYRDAGVEEFVLTSLRSPHTPEEAVTVLEKAAREWLEPASKL